MVVLSNKRVRDCLDANDFFLKDVFKLITQLKLFLTLLTGNYRIV